MISESANRWQGSPPRAVMVNRTKANDEPAGGTWEAGHSGRNKGLQEQPAPVRLWAKQGRPQN